jgi:hypothetical protein
MSSSRERQLIPGALSGRRVAADIVVPKGELSVMIDWESRMIVRQPFLN